MLALPLLICVCSPAPLPQAEAGGGALELAMKMRGAMPAVEVMVNGEGPFLFGLDTCASGMGRVDSALVARLGLPIVGQAAGSDGSGKTTAMQVAKVEYLDLGGLGFEHLELAARDYNQGGLPHIDGILGYGLFARGVLTLDFPGKRVRYDPAAALPEADGEQVLALAGGPVAALEIMVGGKKVLAHLDSGNLAGRFVLPAALVAELTPAGEPRSVGKARTVSGETDIQQVPIRETIAIGAHQFPGETVTYPSPGPTANVGASLLAGFRVSLDQANQRIRLERPPG
jgi:hypothetical protein